MRDGERNLYKGSFILPVGRTVIIHFPLYDGVSELLIGVEPEAVVEKGGTYQSGLCLHGKGVWGGDQEDFVKKVLC